MKNISGFLGNILDSILAIPGLIVELLGDLLQALFVPSEDYFDEKISDLKSRFTFVDSMCATVDVFVNFFNNNSFLEPPVITVNLSSTTSSRLNYGINAKMIDFKWYEPFKGDVDLLISSILWVVFAWNVFKDIPNILSGVAGNVNITAEISSSEEKKGI